MKNKLVVLFVTLLLLNPFVSEAIKDEFSGDTFDVPKSLFISDATINQSDVGLGKPIEGKINILSTEDIVVAGYKLSFELRRRNQGDSMDIYTITQANIIDVYHSPKELILNPNSSTTETFSYVMPQFFPKGDYYLRIILRNPELMMIDSYVLSIGSFSGDFLEKGAFIELSESIIKRKPDDTDWSLNIGVVSNQEESLVLKGKSVLKGGQDSIEVYPKLVVYERAAGEKIVYESKNLSSLQLEKDVSKPFEILIPKIGVPGVYFAELVFEKDRKSISNIIDFHWVVAGESGRIINLTMNKTIFNSGEEAVIDMQFADRADLSQVDIESLGEVKILTTLSCSDNYQKTLENIINMNDNTSLQVKIPVDKNVKDCNVKIDLLKDDTQLHSKVLAYSQDGLEDKANNNNNNIVTFISLVLGLISLIGGVAFFVIKKKNINSKLFLIPLLFIFLGLSYDSAMAGSCKNITIAMASPQPSPMEYKYGEDIPLRGSAVITYCTNYPADLKLSFYLDNSTTPFYSRDYYVPAGYNQSSIEFGTPTISGNPLTPGVHKIRMEWFQDCTRQGEGTAGGSMTRTFRVKQPGPDDEVVIPKLRLDPSYVITNAELDANKEVSFRALFDDDDDVTTLEQDVSSLPGTVWSVTSGSPVTSLGGGKFNIPAFTLGDYRITAKRQSFDANGTLSVQGLATPMESDIIIQSNKDRKIVAVATSRGGVFPYTYKDWKLIGEGDQVVELEGQPIVSNTEGASGGNKVEFNVAPSVIAPQKIKIEVRSEDSKGAFDTPFREFRYFGDTVIKELNP